MKAGVVFTGTGPILILTTYASFADRRFAEKLSVKGIVKYIAYELPLELVREKYATHIQAVMNDVGQADDLRVLDYDGHHIFHNFSFADLGEPIFFEP